MRRALAISVLLLAVSAPVALGRPSWETITLLVPKEASTRGFEAQAAADSRIGWKRITVPVEGSVEETRNALERDLGTTVLVERRYSLFDAGDEPLFDQQWALENTGQTGGTPDADIDATAAWAEATGDGVVVAVVDSGVEPTHPELAAQIWQNADESHNGVDDDGNGFVDDVSGWDFEGEDNDPSPGGTGDTEAHATFIAGIIAAEVNGDGVAGVAFDARIMNVRACRDGGCLTFDATQAIYYAVDNGADIINLSFGAPFPEDSSDPPLEEAIEYARRHDVLVVTAAGNTSPDSLESGYIILPAEFSHTNNVAVAGTDKDDLIHDQSYYGENIDIAAPGVEILSTGLTSYGIATGTSFAAPHVAGVAALLLSTDAGMGHEELAARIKAWADKPPDVEGKVESGRVNAGATLNNRFVDIPGSTFEMDIEWLADEGITKGCDPPENIMFCPDDPVTRGQMAAFLYRFLDLPPASEDYFTDDDGNTFEADINAIAEAGITKGCNPPDNDEYCPHDAVSRDQMAAFIVRAFGLSANSHDGFTDVSSSSTFYEDIGKLATAGITKGCNPPDNTLYCPREAVTRGQMSAFLHRSE